MSITINPGTGPVAGTKDQARANMNTFAQDVADQHGYDLAAATIRYIKVEPETTRIEPYEMETLDGRMVMTELFEYTDDPEGDGRFTYRLSFSDDLRFDVEMPGLPLERVRYTGADGQRISDYPRLYVDGSSWVWKFAVSACRIHDDEEF